ncbi:MAG: TlpA disulfide reductase family protein [Pseudolabrys sp.]
MIAQAAPEYRGTSFIRFIARTAGATMVAVAVVSSIDLARAAELVPWTGAAPPGFTLPQFGAAPGSAIALASESGEAILVHFFASWCEPCREELPALQRLAERGHPGIKILAISVADVDAPLRRLLDATGVTFPVLMDRDRAVARSWDISALPSTVILDSRHTAWLIVESDFGWDALEPKQLTDRLTSTRNDLHAQQSLVTQGGQ